MFSSVQFMTAEEKQRVFNQWTRFIKGGFRWSQFHDALYKHLINHCSFIAHYNRAGFYDVYFTNPNSLKRFLNQFETGISCELGMVYWRTGDYQDINEAMMQDWTRLKPSINIDSLFSCEERLVKEYKRMDT